MRFCYPFTLITNPRDGEKALARHQRNGLEANPASNAHFIVSSARAIFLRQIVRLTPCSPNSTEFPVAHNFSKPDLEDL